MKSLADFLVELKRRRVYRVTAVYAGIAFIVIEVVANTFDNLMIPDTVDTVIYVLLALGFPIVIGLAWAFDITDKGIVRTSAKTKAAVTPRRPIFSNTVVGIVVVLAIIVAVWSLLRGPSLGGGAIRSIAVLPLDNIGGDPEDESIVEGMHEALISELCGISAITVISKQSTLQYKGSQKTMPVIASELGVDALVEGSAQRVGERIRITTQLIDSQDRHLWQNTFDRNLEDVFALYDDVTRAIVQEIQVALTPEEEERLASAPRVNPEAYDLYLKGWNQRLLRQGGAAEYLEQAVAIDPTFARAWAALAAVSDRPRRFEALDRALELDPNDVLALTWQGVTQYALLREGAIRTITGAAASFRRALELEPSNFDARYEYGLFLQRTGFPSEALAEFQLAKELNPFSPLSLEGLATTYGGIRHYDKAREYAQAALELSPGNTLYIWWVASEEINTLLQQGQYTEAAAMAAKGAAGPYTSGQRSRFFWQLLRAEGALGNQENIYAILDSLIALGLSQHEHDNPFAYARYYSMLKEKDKALDLLEDAFVNVNQPSNSLLYNPEFDFLRDEPRYKRLTQRIAMNFQGFEWTDLFDQNGNLIIPMDETLEAYNAPGSR